MRYRITIVLGALLQLAGVPIEAQDSLFLGKVAPGARIRVDAPSVLTGRLETSVISWSHDSVTLRGRERRVVAPGDERLASLTIPVDRIITIDVSRGRSWWMGASFGLAVGAAAGLVYGAADNRRGDPCLLNCGAKPSSAHIFARAVGIGAAGGAVVGALARRERWRRVDVEPRSSTRSQLGASR